MYPTSFSFGLNVKMVEHHLDALAGIGILNHLLRSIKINLYTTILL